MTDNSQEGAAKTLGNSSLRRMSPMGHGRLFWSHPQRVRSSPSKAGSIRLRASKRLAANGPLVEPAT